MGVDLLAGVALGTLLGLLVGLTSSPVVAIVVGALASGLLVLLGYNAGKPADEVTLAANRANAWRLCGFGFAAAAALLVGLAIRTHEVFTPSPDLQVKRLTASGFSPDEAHAWVAYKNAGLLFRVAPETLVDKEHRSANISTTTLMAGGGTDNCALATASNYSSQAEYLNALHVAGGLFGDFAGALQPLDPAHRAVASQFLQTAFCH